MFTISEENLALILSLIYLL